MPLSFYWMPSPVKNPNIQGLTLENMPDSFHDIVSLDLSHDEGHQARLEITVPSQSTLPCHVWGALFYTDSQNTPFLLFQGRIEEIPTSSSLSPFLVTLSFKAVPEDAEDQLQKLLDQWKQTSLVYDPLFVSPDRLQDPHLIRFFEPYVFYWDPKELSVHLSDLRQKGPSFDATSVYIPSSLTTHLKNSKTCSFAVKIEAQWIQEITGFFNLGPQIMRLFPEGVIQTYTPSAFKAAWPRAGHFIGRSNYWVAASRLEDLTPPFQESDSREPWRKLKKEFKGKLLMGWTFQQKRIESFSFSFGHAASKENAHMLTLRLQPLYRPSSLPLWEPFQKYRPSHKIQQDGKEYLCLTSHLSQDSFEEDQKYWQEQGSLPHTTFSSDSSSFFLSPRGRKSVETGIEIANTHSILNRRSLEVSLTLPFELCARLTLNNSISLKDPRLPQGAVTGHIVRLHLSASGKNGLYMLHVTLRTPLDTFSAPDSEAALSSTPLKTVSGIGYSAYEDQIPPSLYTTEHESTQPRIKKLALLNGPDVQEAFLKTYDGRTSRPALGDMATRILIKFHKFPTFESIHHHIHVMVSPKG